MRNVGVQRAQAAYPALRLLPLFAVSHLLFTVSAQAPYTISNTYLSIKPVVEGDGFVSGRWADVR